MQCDDVITNPRWRTDAILKIVFLAISRRHIGQSTRNLDLKYRITCQYSTHDQNCNFRKFKMADGRHFENSIISISQPRIIRFHSNLVGRCIFQFPWWTFNKKSKFFKFKMADGRHIENRFLAISRRHINRLTEIWNRDEGSHANIDHVTKTAIFANSRWRTAAILKIALSPYLSRELSDFDQIWYADANLHSGDGYLTKSRNFSNSRWRTDAILKIVFGYISEPYWPIDAKFGKEMKNHMPIQVTWPKLQFSKIQEGHGHHFENSFRRLHHSCNELMLIINPVTFNRHTSFNEIMKTANIIQKNCTQSI